MRTGRPHVYRSWQTAKASAARSIVRRVVAEALVATTVDDSPAWTAGAVAMAAEVLRRLGLAPIGRDVASETIRKALGHDAQRDARADADATVGRLPASRR